MPKGEEGVIHELHSGCFTENRQLGGKGLKSRPDGRLLREDGQKIRVFGGQGPGEVVRCGPL